MGIDTSSIRFGIAAQASAGTLAANPTYLFGVESGSDVTTNPEIDDAPLTSGSATLTNAEIRALGLGYNITTRAYEGSIGLVLKHALGECVTTSGTPNSHVYNYARPLPAGLSVFKEYGADGVIEAVRDNKVGNLTLEWSQNGPLIVRYSGVGTVHSTPVSITPANDETGVLTYFRPVGGTFEMDLDGTTLAARCVSGGTLTIDNNITAKFCSGSLQASEVSDGVHRVSLGITVSPDDTAERLSIIAAHKAGTILYGSIKWVFKSGTNTLTIEAARVMFEVYDVPANPDDSNFEVTLSGRCYTPTGWEGPVKITLTNVVASY